MKAFFKTRIFRFLVLLLLLGIVVGATAPWLIRAPAWALVRNDDPDKGADAIVLLMGDVPLRTRHAARLYREGYAPIIVFSRTRSNEMIDMGSRKNDGAASLDYLLRLGVPREAIVYLDFARIGSTRDEAAVTLEYLGKHHKGLKRFIIVTHWFHTSRAGWIFERLDRDQFTIQTSPAESPRHSPTTWYQHEKAVLAVYTEYLKWLYYLLFH